MKAVRFHEYGAPEVLRYEDVRQPVPGAGEVRIRVAATTFNGVDANIRAGNMRGPIPVVLPHIPGVDVAGTVDALGEGVDGVEVGEEVVGFLPMLADGAAAEYVLSPAETLTAAPTTVRCPMPPRCRWSASPPGRRSSTTPGLLPGSVC
jgi:NADPH:quinone reductase-like Zn-dependent oxidoreductase